MMKNQNKNTRGFTLIELLVTISIMVIIMSVVLINYHQYNSTFGITNLAYDIALSARTAQTYGVAVHADQGGSGQTQFEYGYGLHFDATDPDHYILFADNPTSGTPNYYDGGMDCASGSECVTKYTLQSGYTISNICVTDVSGTQQCVTIPEPAVSTLFFSGPILTPKSAFIPRPMMVVPCRHAMSAVIHRQPKKRQSLFLRRIARWLKGR